MTEPHRLPEFDYASDRKRYPPAHAATVIVARDSPEGMAVLMTRRASQSAFGGMWVFPGGKVDADDYSADAPDDLIEASRRAAVREAKEEADLDLDATSLVAYSHWAPPIEASRRFLTWFFVAPAPPGTASDVTIDNYEITDHAWLTPAASLAMHRDRRIELAPPTYLTLFHLARVADTRELIDRATATEPIHYTTALARTGELNVVLWEGDIAYPDGDLIAPGPRHRIEMSRDGWNVLLDLP